MNASHQLKRGFTSRTFASSLDASQVPDIVAFIMSQALKAKGAAMRSKGVWYELSYSCKAKDNYLNITDFNYQVGKIVPHNEWNKHYLVA